MQKTRGSHWVSILMILVLVFVFFWKVYIKDLVLLPADLMVGSYFPWLEQKWGYVTGVSVKNPLMSDAFSTFYVWKMLIAESYKNLSWPLWNQYSYSGYPLLANFNSAALYPLNVLLLGRDFASGWNYLVISQVLGAALTMYWALTCLNLRRGPSMLGAIAYGFGGFMLAWMENVTVGGSMIFLPLLIVFIEKYMNDRNLLWLWFLPLVFELIILAGFFQTMVYATLFTTSYLVYRLRAEKIGWSKTIGVLVFVGAFGLLLGAIQLLPTIELMQRSIRFSEGTLSNYEFGLSPLKNLITLVAPDYFGNPTTGNFSGFINYMETLIYSSLIGIWALIGSLYRYSRLGRFRFFVLMAVISLLMFFDTPLGRLVYVLRVPLVSTSGAGRVAVMFSFAVSILIAKLVEDKKSWSRREGWSWLFWIVLTLSLGGLLGRSNLVAVRNLVIPVVLTALLGLSLVIQRHKWWIVVLTVILVVDLFRFGWKFVPMTERRLVFPKTELISFLHDSDGIFRIEKEKGPLLPPNTWAGYGLMSTSGYDPMAVRDYVTNYQRKLNADESGATIRYSELERYDAKALGRFNVRYLVALKERSRISDGGEGLNSQIDPKDWVEVMETDKTVLLENKHVLPRVEVLDERGEPIGNAEMREYDSQKIVADYQTAEPGWLVVRDSDYPGWRAWVNGVESKVERYDGVFRKVRVDRGAGSMMMTYEPMIFTVGKCTSLSAGAVWVAGVVYLVSKRRRRANSD